MAGTTSRAPLAEYNRKRDFTRTSEPAGRAAPAADPRALRFVIQKHAASRLHFDLRLELDGVMKSWAVPKGPSLDPAHKRLAIEVEDHPIEYNTFEGTIPAGEYGGGTVMLWDRGTYTGEPDGRGEGAGALRRGYADGKMVFFLDGERLRGRFALVRLGDRAGARTSRSDKPQWLLIKEQDEYAEPGSDIVADTPVSIDSGRTMDEIAAGRKPARRRTASTRKRPARAAAAAAAPARRKAGGSATPAAKLPALEPMYATIGTAVPEGDGWTFEPKYDGIRVLAFATREAVRLVTRNAKDKAAQFPEISTALRALAGRARRPLVLDGEIVALVDGSPARFQELQGRMHLKEAGVIDTKARNTPAALIAFDLLADGDDVLLREPWSERRRRLELRLRNRTSEHVRLGESIPGDGTEMLERARAAGWEGIIAKRTDAAYEPGRRARHWLKLKIEFRQEFVIGGFTEPRNSREHLGALLLGYFDRGRLVYVGHTGGGFTHDGLRTMRRRLEPLERKTSPFTETPRTNERAHWVSPKVVVEVKFNEWTADGKLRQPIFLGVRDDKPAAEVGREPPSVQRDSARHRSTAARQAASAKRSRGAAKRGAAKRGAGAARRRGSGAVTGIVAELERMEEGGGEGTLALPDDISLEVTSLGKVFYPKPKLTKGDLMRYYARVSPALLPAIADRPLVFKRHPNGVKGPSFYQQNAGEHIPDGIRVEEIVSEKGEHQRRFVGGDLATLLYSVQLGCISVDPWHSRVQSLDHADYTILDLDPGPRAPFERVVEVALLVRETLDELGLHGVAKTSGSSGMHIVVPLPPATSNETALLLAQLIATRVSDRAPKIATIERTVKERPPTAVYVDYLQNIRAKTVASVYSARAKDLATVSTPLRWEEVTSSLDPREFTIETVPPRVDELGDIWGAAMKQRNSLRGVLAVGNK
jgi:bifunctional non-homologous end joining protein LigD